MVESPLEKRTIQIAGHNVEFVQCPAGSFYMGSNAGLPLEQPTRPVTIHAPFWFSTTLITQELWINVMSENPSTFVHSGALPVDGISHDDATKFCQSASIASGHHFFLPSEAQWEYACRAGTTTEYFWGASESDAQDFGWFDLNAGDTTHDVASLAANPWGLFDIVGNLWEWCSDVWHSDYHNAPDTDESRHTNADRQLRRCLRGGAWDMDAFRLRSAYRSYDHRELGTSRFGMRIVMTN